MVQDLLNGCSVAWLKLEHRLHEVLELLGKEGFSAFLVLAVGSPEDVTALAGQASVEWIGGLSSSKRWMLSYHDEEDDS